MPFSFQIEESFLLGGVEGGRDRVDSCLPIILYCRYINMNVQWLWINYTHFKSQKETYLSHSPQFLFFVQHWNRNIQHYCWFEMEATASTEWDNVSQQAYFHSRFILCYCVKYGRFDIVYILYSFSRITSSW